MHRLSGTTSYAACEKLSGDRVCCKLSKRNAFLNRNHLAWMPEQLSELVAELTGLLEDGVCVSAKEEFPRSDDLLSAAEIRFYAMSCHGFPML